MNIFLIIPTYGGLDHAVVGNLTQASRAHAMRVDARGRSVLTTNFNYLWCAVLNAAPWPDYACMVHSDIACDPEWLDRLVEEQQACGADVLSAVVPIKDESGDTSTGFVDEETGEFRRFSEAEVAELPETFGDEHLGAGRRLLANTGLMLVNMRLPLWRETDEAGRLLIRFHQTDEAITGDDGKFYPRSFSEDWNFSLEAGRRGAKVMATRKVPVGHCGRKEYRLQSAPKLAEVLA